MADQVNKTREMLLGIVAAAGAIYLGLSIYTYHKWDPSLLTFTTDPSKNSGGMAGAYLADLIMTAIGYASYTLPLFLLAYAIRRAMSREHKKVHTLGALLFTFSASVLLTLLFMTFNLASEVKPGGLAGYYAGGFLEKYLSILGSYLVAVSAFFSSIILLGPVSMPALALSRVKAGSAVNLPQKGILEEDIIVKLPEESDGSQFEDNLPQQLPLIPVLEEKPVSRETKKPVSPQPSRDGYILPSLEFLTIYDTSEAMDTDDDKRSNASQLKTKLADFDVNGNITRIEQGPVITLYEFEPAPGIKITRVVNLADDLALALKAQSIRVSPISGKATIGIEVPNRKRAIVAFRDIISSEEFNKKQSKLTLALGKNISGNPIVADLTRMPHLLVAGATGAGKSVSINAMVMSILYKATPKEVKLLMIDPKLLELSMYEGIPHLISPIITSPKAATEALRKMVFEMERRYRLLAEKGARNIDSFNSQSGPDEQMPYIIVFIDELADLMFASSRDVEDSITRLAQMARAAGIHLIIATQRPSVDVITGLIKANFPARISFQVFSKIDSRTILDSQGAEQLLGKGDMLLLQPGDRLIRVHGALVTEAEIKRVTDFIKAQAKPDYSGFEEMPAEAAPSEEAPEERDDMYYKALEFAESTGEVSISSIQRRFKIGYNRAASIMEMMEDDGLVGPPKGAGKPRDFLRRQN